MKFDLSDQENLYKDSGLKRSNYLGWLAFITLIIGLVFGLLTFAISIKLKIISSLTNDELLIKHDYYPDSAPP